MLIQAVRVDFIEVVMYVIDFNSTPCGEVPVQSKKKTLEQLPLMSL